MSVDFGSARQAVVGKSKLTKRVQSGFVVSTMLPIDEIWTIAELTCAEYPQKKKFGYGDMGALVYIMRGNKRRCIGYGSLKTASDGTRMMVTAQWALSLEGFVGGIRMPVVFGKLTSGKINEVVEMELFLNEFERQIQAKDASASIDFAAPA